MTFQDWLKAGKADGALYGQYVLLSCKQQYVHEDEVRALSVFVDKETEQSQLTYICPQCKDQHTSLLEG